jgi:hypothetical protein
MCSARLANLAWGPVSKQAERTYSGGRCKHWIEVKNPEASCLPAVPELCSFVASANRPRTVIDRGLVLLAVDLSALARGPPRAPHPSGLRALPALYAITPRGGKRAKILSFILTILLFCC